ncbi:MAG: GNAT family N-acetyltransferase [Candidatus Spechtbacterales bacterium]|nr:GNAT family N-acetyltransferase [Candidatus Spechtbacterales bacterium]
MKILLLGFNRKTKSYTVKKLVKELKKRGHTVNYMSWRALVFAFSTKKGVSIQRINGTDLKYYDYVIPKSPIKSSKTDTEGRLSRLYRHYYLVVRYINQHHKHALNEKTIQKLPVYDKLFQYYLLSNEGLPVVTSRLYTGKQTPSSVYDKFKKPYIVKSIEGLAGKQVFLIKDKEEIPDLVKSFGLGKLLVQRYIPIKHDYRILVLGNKVIGGMKRTSADDDFRTNVSRGGTADKIEPSKEMKDIAKKAAKVFGAEFCGVDLIKYKGKFYILEVNIFPGFEGFESATKINVAEQLVSHIEKKYLWSLEVEFNKKEKKAIFKDLYKIEKENLEKPLTEKGFKKTLKERDLIVIRKEKKPIAYLTHYKKENTRRVTRWGITPKYRGQRMGRRMLRALISISIKEGDEKINAVLPASNKKRQNTYKRAGFTKTEKLEGFFEEDDGLVFEYKIIPSKRVKGAGLTRPKSKKKKGGKKKKNTKKKKAEK